MADRKSAVMRIIPAPQRIVALLAVVALLAACATTIKPEQASNIKRVGVISFIGDDFRVYDYGFTIFERRDRKRLQKPDWSVQQLVQNAYKAAIDENSGYTYVATRVDRDKLAAAFGAQSGEVWERLDDKDYYSDASKISSELKALGASNNVDTWVIVSPLRTTSPIWQRDLYIVGAGVIREVTAVGRKAAVFSNVAVEVVAADSGNVLGSTTNQGSENIDTAVWEKATEATNAADASELLNPLQKVMRTQASTTLKKVGLTR